MSAATASCRALLVSAPASGQGKTTVTAALARAAVRRGLRVQLFKTGPDFIDPMLLEQASGQPVYQLDLWMGGEAHCRNLLQRAATHADLILVEGVMGLYDGTPSSADLAERFGLPVLAVIDGSAMAQTFGAIATGLSQYRHSLRFHGVVANRVGSERHAQMLAQSLPAGLHWLGALARDADIAVPERHLGLLQAGEIIDLDARIDRAADALTQTLGDGLWLDKIPLTPFSAAADTAPPRLLEGLRIAVARDAAFSFVYRANLDLLTAMGAQLRLFSPLADSALPEVDSIYLPGGYPELHAATLAANHDMLASLRAHVAQGKPMLAECGGMMLLFEALTDVNGRRHVMAGALAGETAMQNKLQSLALQGVAFPDGELRGHAFHYSQLSTALTPAVHGCTQSGTVGAAVYQRERLTASYIHFYLPSNPVAAAQLLRP